MTVDQLHEALEKDSLTLEEVKNIIYQLKNDCVRFDKDAYISGFYNGEMNAFYIVLDLLDKVV